MLKWLGSLFGGCDRDGDTLDHIRRAREIGSALDTLSAEAQSVLAQEEAQSACLSKADRERYLTAVLARRASFDIGNPFADRPETPIHEILSGALADVRERYVGLFVAAAKDSDVGRDWA